MDYFDIEFLKPCPFCGSAPKLIVRTLWNCHGKESYEIGCVADECFIQPITDEMTNIVKSREECIEILAKNWNTRI